MFYNMLNGINLLADDSMQSKEREGGTLEEEEEYVTKHCD